MTAVIYRKELLRSYPFCLAPIVDEIADYHHGQQDFFITDGWWCPERKIVYPEIGSWSPEINKITARAGLHGVRDHIARPDLGLSVQKQWMDWFNIYPKLWFLAPNWLGRVHHWLAFTLGKKRHKNKWPNPLHHSQDTLGPGSGTWEGRGWRGLVSSSKLSGANDQLCSPSYLLSHKKNWRFWSSFLVIKSCHFDTSWQCNLYFLSCPLRMGMRSSSILVLSQHSLYR